MSELILITCSNNLKINASKVDLAYKMFTSEVNSSKILWDDDVFQEFENTTIHVLDGPIKGLQKEILQLAQVLHEASIRLR